MFPLPEPYEGFFDKLEEVLRQPLQERQIGRDDYDWGFVSTVRVGDGAHPYETAVEHPDYNNGSMVIVEAYDTMEDATIGHARWCDTMVNEPPDMLQDCCNAQIATMGVELGMVIDYPRQTH